MNPVKIEFLVEDNTRAGLSGVSHGLVSVDKGAETANRKIKELEETIARLKVQAAKTSTTDADKYAKQIEMLKQKLAELQATAQSTKIVPPNLPKATQQFNGLNVSIQQIARELPSLAMGPQMFFMAISNNLPIFTDQLAAARKQYEALTAAGQKATPVWKQVLSSIVSWQTLLAVGIMLSVTYGKEIGNWIKGLFSAKTALDTAAVAAERFHATMAKGRVEAQKEIVQLDALYRVASDMTRPYNERRAAVKKLQEVYPAYFGNMSDEQIMVGEAIDKYNTLREAILATAEARAAADAITENQKQVTLLKQTGEAYEQYKRSLDDVSEAKKKYDAADKKYSPAFSANGTIQYNEITPELFSLKAAEAQMQRSRKAFEKELLKLSGGEELWEQIKEQFDENINDFEENIRRQNERLLPLVDKIAAGQTVEDQNKAAEEAARRRAQQVASAASLDDQYIEAMLHNQQELDDLLVEEQENGFDKERAAIRNRYAKRKTEYEQQEAKLLALVKKLREAGRDLGPDAERHVQSLTSLKITAAEAVRDRDMEAVDKREADEYDRLLAKYETYMQGRLHITRKYDDEIARLNDPAHKERAERAKQKALDDFAVEFASQFPEFEAWADRIITASVDKLKGLIVDARKELDRLQVNPTADQNAIAKAQAKIVTLQKLISKAENKTTDTRRWRDLHSVLSDVINTFNEVGEAIDGAGGQIVSTMGEIAGASLQMVDSIQAFREASEKKDKLGMATGILGAISAGLSVITTIAGLFGGESSLERNLRVAREFNEELRIAKERARIDSDEFSSVFGDRLFARYRQNVDAAIEAMEDLEEVQKRVLNRGEEIRTNKVITNTEFSGLELIKKTWDSIGASIRNMQVQTRHSTWFRSAKYKSLGDLLPELFSGDDVDMDLLKKFVEEGDETFQHLSKENREMLEQMVADWETYEEAVSAVRDYLSDIFGELGNTLTDALVDAFENGTDAAEVFTESVGQALRKLAKDMIYSQTLGKVFDDAQKRIEQIYESGESSETKFALWSEVMKQLIDDAMNQQQEFDSLWAEFLRLAEERGIPITDTEALSQTGKAGALQTVTQDSFSRVEGLITSIQIHAASLDEEFEGHGEDFTQALEKLDAIATNTLPIKQIYDLLESMYREGMKIKG